MKSFQYFSRTTPENSALRAGCVKFIGKRRSDFPCGRGLRISFPQVTTADGANKNAFCVSGGALGGVEAARSERAANETS
jgi:hypothetical protein